MKTVSDKPVNLQIEIEHLAKFNFHAESFGLSVSDSEADGLAVRIIWDKVSDILLTALSQYHSLPGMLEYEQGTRRAIRVREVRAADDYLILNCA